MLRLVYTWVKGRVEVEWLYMNEIAKQLLRKVITSRNDAPRIERDGAYIENVQTRQPRRGSIAFVVEGISLMQAGDLSFS